VAHKIEIEPQSPTWTKPECTTSSPANLLLLFSGEVNEQFSLQLNGKTFMSQGPGLLNCEFIVTM